MCPFLHVKEFSDIPLMEYPVMEYWWAGSTSAAILPTSTSDIVSQHHKIGQHCSQPSELVVHPDTLIKLPANWATV